MVRQISVTQGFGCWFLHNLAPYYWGNLTDEEFYQVSLTFDPKAIADFLIQQQLKHYPTLPRFLQQANLTGRPFNLQSQFMPKITGNPDG